MKSLTGIECEIIEYEQSSGTEDIRFFLKMARKAGGLALDLGCGTGRISIPLAADGFAVVGIDNSQAALQEFKRKIANAELRHNIRILRADMRRFWHREKFGCAVCSSNTLLLLGSIRSIKKALTNIAAHLQPGGWLIFDVATIDREMVSALKGYSTADIPDLVFDMPDGYKLCRAHSLKTIQSNAEEDKAEIKYKYFWNDGNPCGERIEALALVRPENLLSILRQVGFETIETYGWYDGRPFTMDERKLLVAAKKRV